MNSLAGDIVRAVSKYNNQAFVKISSTIIGIDFVLGFPSSISHKAKPISKDLALELITTYLSPLDEATLSSIQSELESFDLFEHHECIPAEIADLINEYNTDSFDYSGCKELSTRLKSAGYCCDYDLNAIIFDLKPM